MITKSILLPLMCIQGVPALSEMPEKELQQEMVSQVSADGRKTCEMPHVVNLELFSSPVKKSSWEGALGEISNNPFVVTFMINLRDGDNLEVVDVRCYEDEGEKNIYDISFKTPDIGDAILGVAVSGSEYIAYSLILKDYAISSE